MTAPSSSPERKTVPLSRRKWDWVFIGFFLINFTFITYVVDLEQLVIADPNNFEYPIWPIPPLIDLVHWWAKNFDPVLWARPAWWRATIWIDSLFFGPFYAAAIYAFIKGRNWIRNFSFIWAGLMMANVTIIMFEEMIGTYPTPARLIVCLANLPWFCFPLLVCWRMWKEHPFSAPALSAQTANEGAARLAA